MIELATRRSNLPKYELRVMSAESLSFENQFFDTIILSHVISVVSDIDKAMDELIRVTKKNGKIYILNHFVTTQVV